jgi:hypothetical protein
LALRMSKAANRIKKVIDFLDTTPVGPLHPYEDFVECGLLDEDLQREYEDMFGDTRRLNRDQALDFLRSISQKYQRGPRFFGQFSSCR